MLHSAAVEAHCDDYALAVGVLRNLSRNHEDAPARMCAARAHTEGMETTAAALGERVHSLEDQELRCLCALSRSTSEEAVFRAIDDAHAGWLRAVILNRAVETSLAR